MQDERQTDIGNSFIASNRRDTVLIQDEILVLYIQADLLLTTMQKENIAIHFMFIRILGSERLFN